MGVSIELLDGENEILVSGLESVTAMATDGIYIPATAYAEENDIAVSNLRVWKKRFQIEAVTLFGRLYVKKGAQIETRRYRKCHKKRAKVQI